MDFEEIVKDYYQPLYRFALSLSRSADAAGDLTQQTFCLWARKGHQLRDLTRVKSWLFTTLYREHLGLQSKLVRFPHQEISSVEHELPDPGPEQVNRMESADLMKALQALEPAFREPLTLFYVEDLSYKEIADILNVPIGTIMSRLSRGKSLLKQSLLRHDPSANRERKLS
jgi:RNA polymerase sigma-70 factor (ECF subfamily)